jgi:hypothetical protein
MRFTSSSYEVLLKVLIQGLEDKTLTVKLLKEELKLNKEREDEVGEHSINPSSYLEEALEEALEEKNEKPKPKKKVKKSLIVEYVEDVVRFPYRAPKEVIEQYVIEKGMKGKEKANFLTRMTKGRHYEADNMYQVPRPQHAREQTEEFQEWLKTKKV